MFLNNELLYIHKKLNYHFSELSNAESVDSMTNFSDLANKKKSSSHVDKVLSSNENKKILANNSKNVGNKQFKKKSFVPKEINS